MPLLLRSNMEKRNMRRFSLVLMQLALQAAQLRVPAAAIFFGTGAASLAGLAVAPSRRCVLPRTPRLSDAALICATLPRSWQSGINRAPLWAFENMYSEEECWNRMRLPGRDPALLREVSLCARAA